MAEFRDWEDLVHYVASQYEEASTVADVADLGDELKYIAESMLWAEMHGRRGVKRFWMAYAEAVTDPHQARGDFDDLQDGEDPMERAAKEFSRMAYCGKWEELALNLEGVI